jgi:uncharacterized protein (DUF433 family)
MEQQISRMTGGSGAAFNPRDPRDVQLHRGAAPFEADVWRPAPSSGCVHAFAERPEPREPARTPEALEVSMDKRLVSRDPEVMSGALCFTGTRVPVRNLFDYLEGRSSLEDFPQDFPSVSRAQAVAVLEAARTRLAADAPAA